MSGFLGIEEVVEFSRQEQAAVEQMGCGSGEFLLMVHTGDAVIQSQEVVAKLTDLVLNSPLKAKRIAVVRGGSLTRMQTSRILMVRENAAMFLGADEAEAWLFGAVHAPATPDLREMATAASRS
jgi:hypothetical protein